MTRITDLWCSSRQFQKRRPEGTTGKIAFSNPPNYWERRKQWSFGRRNMIGQYVRMVAAPKTRIGIIQAARFDRDHASFLFHQDPRITFALPDLWMRDFELEECGRPTDEQIAKINDITTRDP